MKTQALVLSALSYGDRQLIVDLFSREAGRQSFIVQLAAGRKGKMRKMLFQPLMLLDVDFTQRPTRTLQRFSEVSISRPWLTLCADPIKIQLVFFVAELLRYATRDEQQPQSLFDYVVDSMQWLDTATEGYANFHLVFMMRLSRFIGFYPNLDEYSEGAWFDLRDGSFVRACPSHPDYLQPNDARKILLLMRMNFDNMRFFKMNREERGRCLDVIITYFRLHVPNFPEMKSLSVLKALF